MSATVGAATTRRTRGPVLPSRRLEVPVGALGVGLLWATAAVHLHLYAIGYRSIAVIGWLFLVQGIIGSVLGLAILAFRHLLVYLGGTAYMAASIGGFVTSIWLGLFGFRDSFAAPFAGVAMALEVSGAVVFLIAAGLWLRGHQWRIGFRS